MVRRKLVITPQSPDRMARGNGSGPATLKA